MKRGIKSDVARATKKIAGQAAKQVIREPFEVLKQARKQVAGQEKPETQIKPAIVEKKAEVSPEQAAKIKAQGQRQIQALEAEIEDIRRQKKLEEEQELRQEELEERKKKEKPKPPPAVSSKPSRKIMRGIKGKLQRLKRRTEIRMPPTG